MPIYADIYGRLSRGRMCFGLDDKSVFPEDAFRVVVMNALGPVVPAPNDACVLIARGPFNSVCAIPCNADEVRYADCPTEFGGCYVGSRDPRFSELCGKIHGRPFPGAVPLHDRKAW